MTTGLISVKESPHAEDAVVLIRTVERDQSGKAHIIGTRRFPVKATTYPATGVSGLSGSAGVLQRLPEGARLSNSRFFMIDIDDLSGGGVRPGYASIDEQSKVAWTVGSQIDALTVPEAVEESVRPGTLMPGNDDAIEYKEKVFDVIEVAPWYSANFFEIMTLQSGYPDE